MRFHYAILSGICAASAGAFGKLSGLEVFKGLFVVRIILFGAMLLSNVAVWTLFVKALHQSNSSLIATIISSTSNYLFTAVLGYFLLDEVTSTLWWTGILFVVIGLVFILSEESKSSSTEFQTKKQ